MSVKLLEFLTVVCLPLFHASLKYRYYTLVETKKRRHPSLLFFELSILELRIIIFYIYLWNIL